MKYKPKCKWICLYPVKSCYQSIAHGKCCCECEKRKECEYVCLNTPEKCGAMKTEDFKDV